MALEFLQEVCAALRPLEIWLGGVMMGVIILILVNYLAAGYRGPRSVFDVTLSFIVFLSMGAFFLLVGPEMVLKKGAQALFRAVWSDPQMKHFTPQRAAIVFGLGMSFALLTRLPFIVLLLQSRLYACVMQALVTLSTIVYFATEGSGRFVPEPLLLFGFILCGMLIVLLAQTGLVYLFPRTAARTWFLLGPILISISVAPYAGWLRVMNL